MEKAAEMNIDFKMPAESDRVFIHFSESAEGHLNFVYGGSDFAVMAALDTVFTQKMKEFMSDIPCGPRRVIVRRMLKKIEDAVCGEDKK